MTKERMEKDYKVEMKPTLWDVMLTQGRYSDYSEYHLYFRANDEDEVWNFLCRYKKDTTDITGYGNCALVYGEKRFSCKEDDKTDWDTNYGEAEEVTISRLNVIEFQV